MSDGGKATPRVTASLDVVRSPELSHSSTSDIRRILGPLIASNAQARVGSSALGKDTLSAEPQGRLQGLLTDEICDRFAGQMRAVEEGEQSSSSNGLSNMNNNKIPRAPRAMLTSGTVRAAGDALLKQDRNKSPSTKSPIPNLRIPIAIPFSTTPANSQEAAPLVPLSAPLDEKMAIPLDSKFFTRPKSTEREEGEIVGSSSPLSGTPPHAVRKTSPLKRYSISERKYSLSPEPVQHRLPTSRTYRSRSPSEGINYPHTSRSSRSPKPFRRSQSPTHTRRPSSFPNDLKGPSLPPERVRQPGRRRSSLKIPRELTSPRSPRSATHQRRGKSESHSWKDNGYPDKDVKSLISEEKNYSRNVSGGVTPLDNYAFDCERRWSSTRDQDPKFDAEFMPTRSISPTDSKPDHQGDIIAQRRTSLPGGDQNNVFDTGLTASPLSMIAPLPGPTECESSLDDQAQVGELGHDVPGLWMIKAGGNSVEIVTCEFEIDEATADRWHIRGPSRHGKEKARDSLSLSFMCIPHSERAKLDVTSAPRWETTDEITRIEAIWPPAGHLVVEINPDHDWGQSWLPRHLGKEHASIDITDHVHEGMNIIRLIQLASLADCMFVVLAKEKPLDADAKDLGPAPDVMEMEVDEPQTTEQLLASFRTSTRIIYS